MELHREVQREEVARGQQHGHQRRHRRPWRTGSPPACRSRSTPGRRAPTSSAMPSAATPCTRFFARSTSARSTGAARNTAKPVPVVREGVLRERGGDDDRAVDGSGRPSPTHPRCCPAGTRTGPAPDSSFSRMASMKGTAASSRARGLRHRSSTSRRTSVSKRVRRRRERIAISAPSFSRGRRRGPPAGGSAGAARTPPPCRRR